MNKTSSFALGALMTLIPAFLIARHRRQQELERLIAQRVQMQKQLEAQRQLLEQALKALEARG